ncbi:uncharacterized protein LOC118645677 [Monomorium pharaonis]|uniref:uncharacterized protein LOC118645677 n=1 Tax=Monomorium pharaonis TaxID=307658 RepID=UPI0017472EDD|nr:uncharacterized protein LOC118645677 [Monomorium pharaonis]
MPKHKSKKKHSSRRSRDDARSRRDSSQDSYRYRPRESSRERSLSQHKEVRASREDSRRFSSSGHRSSSRNSSSRRSPSNENLLDMLDCIRNLVAQRGSEHNLLQSQATISSSVATRGPRALTMEIATLAGETPTTALPASPPAFEHTEEEQTVAQADRGVVPVRPSDEEGLPTKGAVAFADPPVTTVSEAQIQDTPEVALAKELFGDAQSSQATLTCNPLIMQAIQSTSRKGLTEEVRNSLLSKYDTKDEFAGLAPPKLNKELLAALTSSVIKRDEFQSRSQSQVGSCLRALASGMSVLLSTEMFQSSQEAKPALVLFSDSIHLLADHYFRLSLARRAFTKPSLNMVGKNAAESAPIDDCLFGQDFSQTLKAAQACEKAGREAVKTSAPLGKKSLQPVRQQTQPRRAQPSAPIRSGNQRAPARPSTARRSGARHYKSRQHRSQSRSRSRHHN